MPTSVLHSQLAGVSLRGPDRWGTTSRYVIFIDQNVECVSSSKLGGSSEQGQNVLLSL